MDEFYIRKLEAAVKQMLKPLKNIPFKLVIESISGHTIIPFDWQDKHDKELLEGLKKAAALAGKRVNEKPIIRPRPNEVGNDIESYVKDALLEFGFEAETPRSKSGQKKSAGYPDICFLDKDKRPNYLECKTYNIKNIGSTQRSFFLSPSGDFKITQDGHHFVLSYEILVAGRRAGKNVYKCRHWKIVDTEKLYVDVKYEFNSDNVRLYSEPATLAEGDV